MRIDRRRIRGTIQASANASAAVRAGTDFEKLLEHTHAAYRLRGVAAIERMPLPTVPTRCAAGHHRVFSERTGADYRGMFGASSGPVLDQRRWIGMSLVMEAKSTQEQPSLAIVAGRQHGGVKLHQLEYLVDANKNWGSACAVVWRCGAKVGLLTPDRVEEALDTYNRSGGRRSIPWGRFLEVPQDHGLVDWLYTLRTWMEALDGIESAEAA